MKYFFITESKTVTLQWRNPADSTLTKGSQSILPVRGPVDSRCLLTSHTDRNSASACAVPAKFALPKPNLEEASDKPKMGNKITGEGLEKHDNCMQHGILEFL